MVVVKCGSDGAISLGDLWAELDAHAGGVAAIMLTYPSTSGVYEDTVSQVCDAVHAAGGQVYIDGANLNALVGLATPAGSAGMSRTSTCTRRSASRTAAAARGSPRWRSGPTWPSSCPALSL